MAAKTVFKIIFFILPIMLVSNENDDEKFKQKLYKYCLKKNQLELDKFNYRDKIKIIDYKNYYFSEFSEIAIGPNGNIYIGNSTPDPFLLKYNKFGNNGNLIYRLGDGPGEYKDASFPRVFQDNLYSYDVISLKLTKYNLNGDYIIRYKGPVNSVSDYCVIGDNIFFYLHYNEYNNYRYCRFNQKSKEYNYFGEYNKSGRISSTYAINGMDIDNQGRLYTIKAFHHGFDVYDSSGKFIFQSEETQYSDDFLINDHILAKIDYSEGHDYYELYMNTNKQTDIYYIGHGTIVIQSEQKTDDYWTIEKYINRNVSYPKLLLDFWSTEGKYIGRLYSSKKLTYAKNGKFYFYNEVTQNSQNMSPDILVYEFLKIVNNETNH